MRRYVLVVLLAVAATSSAQDWPQFRGPNFSGVSSEKKPLPTTWNQSENVVWKTPLPARGISSPVVVEDRIYLTANSGFRLDKLHTICLDRKDGKILWQRELQATGNTGCHKKSDMAAPTPVADATGVYCLFATGDLAAFDKDGTLRWYRSLVADYPTIGNQVGMASSPILANNTLIVPMINSGESFLAGIDPRYGNNIWKTDCPKETNWTTPLAVTRKAGPIVLMMRNKELVAYQPDSGKQLWSLPTGLQGSSSPMEAGDTILIPADGITAVTMGTEAKATDAWKTLKLGGKYTTPVYFDGLLYNVTNAKALVCADAKTGKEIWVERTSTKGTYWASPIIGDGKVYVFADDGVCTVAKLGDKAEILAVNDLKEEIMGTPAISNGCLLIRTSKTMYCIGVK